MHIRKIKKSNNINGQEIIFTNKDEIVSIEDIKKSIIKSYYTENDVLDNLEITTDTNYVEADSIVLYLDCTEDFKFGDLIKMVDNIPVKINENDDYVDAICISNNRNENNKYKFLIKGIIQNFYINNLNEGDVYYNIKENKFTNYYSDISIGFFKNNNLIINFEKNITLKFIKLDTTTFNNTFKHIKNMDDLLKFIYSFKTLFVKREELYIRDYEVVPEFIIIGDVLEAFVYQSNTTIYLLENLNYKDSKIKLLPFEHNNKHYDFNNRKLVISYVTNGLKNKI